MAMQEPTFLVLTVLTGPPLHGYGIMRAAAELSPDGPALRAGTLYAALDRLTQEGLVEIAREEPLGPDRVRRFYRLTPRGGTVLRAEADRRARLAAAAVARLAALPPSVLPPPAPA
jgi:PadR family transcriptional regulator PadR